MDQTTKNDLSPTIQTYQAVLNRMIREVELFAYIINREPSLEWVVPVISLKEGSVSQTTTSRDLSAVNSFLTNAFEMDYYGQNDWLKKKVGVQEFWDFEGTKTEMLSFDVFDQEMYVRYVCA